LHHEDFSGLDSQDTILRRGILSFHMSEEKLKNIDFKKKAKRAKTAISLIFKASSRLCKIIKNSITV
jgi:hypothetical protein